MASSKRTAFTAAANLAINIEFLVAGLEAVTIFACVAPVSVCVVIVSNAVKRYIALHSADRATVSGDATVISTAFSFSPSLKTFQLFLICLALSRYWFGVTRLRICRLGGRTVRPGRRLPTLIRRICRISRRAEISNAVTSKAVSLKLPAVDLFVLYHACACWTERKFMFLWTEYGAAFSADTARVGALRSSTRGRATSTRFG